MLVNMGISVIDIVGIGTHLGISISIYINTPKREVRKIQKHM